MHDLDRTQREFASALHELQPEQFEFPGEQEQFEFPGEQEVFGETAAESALQEAGLFETGEAAFETGMPEVGEVPLHESQEMEMAAELLECTNEEELDRFFGGLFRKVGGLIGRVVRSPIGRALGGVLKPLAKAALPIAGKALGTFVGGPVGGMVGGKLASAAGRLFGLELEGLSAEDREFEVARRFVRFASSATRNALAASPTANPQAVAKAAVAAAARRLAPGLLAARAPISPGVAFPAEPTPTSWSAPTEPIPAGWTVPTEPIPAGARRRGIWIRRGRRIVLIGV